MKVHIFVSSGRFRSLQEVRAFMDQTYTEDGDGVPSSFMREVSLIAYEPGCIEVIHEKQCVTLAELLAGASYGDQWIPKLDGTRLADSAICVFAPNQVNRPMDSSLEYIGAFEYVVK